MGQVLMPRGFDPAATPERMAAWIMQYSPATDAEALKLLRARFPEHPLSLRVAALIYFAAKEKGATRPSASQQG
jgi:hypothetical protein